MPASTRDQVFIDRYTAGGATAGRVFELGSEHGERSKRDARQRTRLWERVEGDAARRGGGGGGVVAATRDKGALAPRSDFAQI